MGFSHEYDASGMPEQTSGHTSLPQLSLGTMAKLFSSVFKMTVEFVPFTRLTHLNVHNKVVRIGAGNFSFVQNPGGKYSFFYRNFLVMYMDKTWILFIKDIKKSRHVTAGIYICIKFIPVYLVPVCAAFIQS